MWSRRMGAVLAVALVAVTLGGDALAYPRPNWRRDRFARRVERRRYTTEQRYLERQAAIRRRYHGSGADWRADRAEHRYQANLAHSDRKVRRYRRHRGL